MALHVREPPKPLKVFQTSLKMGFLFSLERCFWNEPSTQSSSVAVRSDLSAPAKIAALQPFQPTRSPASQIFLPDCPFPMLRRLPLPLLPSLTNLHYSSQNGETETMYVTHISRPLKESFKLLQTQREKRRNADAASCISQQTPHCCQFGKIAPSPFSQVEIPMGR
jgi:hypothetical protein